ncbi:MAG: FIST C-terminal domain-containing protein [Gammaproteobacteria bacterium]|nr:FIST C-terminal domain-containing protein [Gammaproteobacteria bacterium]MBU1600863.1 FIST C-terminal domain-containing protein [Gammaproteobacteria bacterium]MBU2435319.1 FIST C-terminal domain-containing protein [Gammaproteobacteria bacterium]MBU2448733.1 FIST C-terminal domain-containing protein [Gammaproteobacteria bacterium]
MRVKQIINRKPADLAVALNHLNDGPADLLLVFGSIEHFTSADFHNTLRNAFPEALLLGCTTAGEITTEGVDDGTCTVTAIKFEQTRLSPATTRLAGMDDSFAAGERLGKQLAAPDLKAVLLFGPGVKINGSALVNGISGVIGNTIPITGGLAGDGGAFRETFTVGGRGVANDQVVAIGLSGDRLRFGHGSFGGWEPFGPARKVTRCTGNVLHELDGEPALEIYRRYLGEHAKGLPASGLLFPFAMLGEDHSAVGLIRTILGIDEASGSLILAGEIDPDGYLRLMHASTDKLVNGAESAAEAALGMLQSGADYLAVLVSCVGRKLVMGDRVDEEIEAVSEVFGSTGVLTGFYSYGEISPFATGASCKLHNQTMTITCLRED